MYLGLYCAGQRSSWGWVQVSCTFGCTVLGRGPARDGCRSAVPGVVMCWAKVQLGMGVGQLYLWLYCVRQRPEFQLGMGVGQLYLGLYCVRQKSSWGWV